MARRQKQEGTADEDTIKRTKNRSSRVRFPEEIEVQTDSGSASSRYQRIADGACGGEAAVC